MPFKKPSDVFPFTASALRRNDNMVAMIADPSPETPAKNEEGVAKMSKAALRKPDQRDDSVVNADFQ